MFTPPQGSVQRVKKPQEHKIPTHPQPKTASSLVFAYSLKYKKVREISEENGWGLTPPRN